MQNSQIKTHHLIKQSVFPSYRRNNLSASCVWTNADIPVRCQRTLPMRLTPVETPARIARACRELFAGLQASPADVLEKHVDVDTDELVLVKDIELYSVCEHHLLPFHGVAHVGYIPAKDGVMGLSKLARLVEVYARRQQLQERLTQQIADALVEYAGARGVMVVTECEHLCMSMRGIKKSSARTVTSAVRGMLRNPATRAEAMSLILDK